MGQNEGTALQKWFQTFLSYADKARLTPPNPDVLVKTLEDAGFVDVKVKTFKQPWGMWPKDKKLKEIGKYVAGIAENGFAVSNTSSSGTWWLVTGNRTDVWNFAAWIGLRIGYFYALWRVFSR